MPRHAQDGPSATPHLGTQHKSIRLPLGSVTRIDAVEMGAGDAAAEHLKKGLDEAQYMYKPPAGSTYRQCVADYVAVATWRDVVLKDLGFTGVTAALSFITGRLSTRRPTAAAPVGYGKLFVDPSLTGMEAVVQHSGMVHVSASLARQPGSWRGARADSRGPSHCWTTPKVTRCRCHGGHDDSHYPPLTPSP
ncbi:unnamed protein product [Vitrella brassicaformis CCMP3155]|uniref:Uncharacterized protein n=1 Tax=Vitrella brassicaformis (strain CCMP3155) TaxID=1169540 RepID=A0A0G4F3G7_VITBC|nr:unnamed protein product [Vitrella brassicaformis CCMP3155]|eukprot:CEM06462.1 unnamed protein product [Vitrella brassicaformis CCMP3155]